MLSILFLVVVLAATAWFVYSRLGSGKGGLSAILKDTQASTRTAELESALRTSELAPSLKAADLDVESIASKLMAAHSLSSSLKPRLVESLQLIRSKNEFLQQLKAATAPYDKQNPEHEALLEQLWEALRPGVRRSGRVTAEWGEIGFQGNDPATDFRGMGLLGLRNLVDFAQRFPKAAQTILGDSAKSNWFGLAITGINLTHDLQKMILSGSANRFLYENRAHMRSFTQLYALCFVRFNEAWAAANPPNVMSFQAIHKPFVDSFESAVRNGSLDFSSLA